MRESILQTLKKVEALEEKVTLETHRKPTKNLSLEEVPALRKAFASITPKIGEFLAEEIRKYQPKLILEVGCSIGYSTLWLSSAAVEVGSKIITTEVNQNRVVMAQEHFNEAGLLGTVQLVNKSIEEVVANWSYGEVDFVFMDEYKADYEKHFQMILPLVKKGGHIYADNVESHSRTVLPFLDRVRFDKSLISEIVDIDNGILKVKKL